MNIDELLKQSSFIRFEIKEYDFDTILPRLLEFEREYQMSSIEMFSRYVKGMSGHEQDIDEWIEIFILYLGTQEVRQFACP